MVKGGRGLKTGMQVDGGLRGRRGAKNGVGELANCYEVVEVLRNKSRRTGNLNAAMQD
jgi:hypothetical protein